jgi:hypothetical protein
MNNIFWGVCGWLQRTKHRNLQEQWLKALLESMALPNISPPLRTGGGPVHFRYSLENLPVIEEVYNVFFNEYLKYFVLRILFFILASCVSVLRMQTCYFPCKMLKYTSPWPGMILNIKTDSKSRSKFFPWSASINSFAVRSHCIVTCRIDFLPLSAALSGAGTKCSCLFQAIFYNCGTFHLKI